MVSTNSKAGHRGYIASRPVRGVQMPQRVQNLVVRDYASRAGLEYRLSAVEYAMPACYMMLEAVLAELEQLDGVILFSLYMLPRNPSRRKAIYQHVLDNDASLHSALEQTVLRYEADVSRFEELILLDAWMPKAHLGGYWHKTRI